jgi:hypothetical protein
MDKKGSRGERSSEGSAALHNRLTDPLPVRRFIGGHELRLCYASSSRPGELWRELRRRFFLSSSARSWLTRMIIFNRLGLT